ncbi:hypothetical protein HDU93_000028 [Gonapodya sp. JEL0774]|nr:hypothetical protein HDU93_000028 [Gonapodya sp. JEL0774]
MGHIDPRRIQFIRSSSFATTASTCIRDISLNILVCYQFSINPKLVSPDLDFPGKYSTAEFGTSSAALEETALIAVADTAGKTVLCWFRLMVLRALGASTDRALRVVTELRMKRGRPWSFTSGEAEARQRRKSITATGKAKGKVDDLERGSTITEYCKRVFLNRKCIGRMRIGDKENGYEMYPNNDGGLKEDGWCSNYKGKARDDEPREPSGFELEEGQEIRERQGGRNPEQRYESSRAQWHLPHPVIECIVSWAARPGTRHHNGSGHSFSTPSLHSEHSVVDFDAVRQRTLAALALTNRTFASVALPQLYSRVAPTSLACFRRFLATCHAWWEADLELARMPRASTSDVLPPRLHSHLTSHIRELILSRLVRSGLSDNELLAFALFTDKSNLSKLILPLEYHYVHPWDILDHAPYVPSKPSSGLHSHEQSLDVNMTDEEEEDGDGEDDDEDEDMEDANNPSTEVVLDNGWAGFGNSSVVDGSDVEAAVGGSSESGPSDPANDVPILVANSVETPASSSSSGVGTNTVPQTTDTTIAPLLPPPHPPPHPFSSHPPIVSTSLTTVSSPLAPLASPPPPPAPSFVILSHPITSNIHPTRPHPAVLEWFWQASARQGGAVRDAIKATAALDGSRCGANAETRNPERGPEDVDVSISILADTAASSASTVFVSGPRGVLSLSHRLSSRLPSPPSGTSSHPSTSFLRQPLSLPIPLGGRLTLPTLALLVHTCPNLTVLRNPEFSDAPQHADGWVKAVVGHPGVRNTRPSSHGDVSVVEWIRRSEVWSRGLRHLKVLDLSSSNNLILTPASSRMLDEVMRACPLEECWTGHLWGADPSSLLSSIPVLRSPSSLSVARELAAADAARREEVRSWTYRVGGAGEPIKAGLDDELDTTRENDQVQKKEGVLSTESQVDPGVYYVEEGTAEDRLPRGRVQWMLEDERWAQGHEGFGSGVAGVDDLWRGLGVGFDDVDGPAEELAERALQPLRHFVPSSLKVLPPTRITPLPITTLQLGGFTYHPHPLAHLISPALSALHPHLHSLELRLDQRVEDAEAACLALPAALPQLERFAVAAPPLSREALGCLAGHPGLKAIILYFSQENWDDGCLKEVAQRGRVETLCMPRSRVTVRGVVGWLASLGTRVKMMDVEDCSGVVLAGTKDDGDAGFAVGKVVVEIPQWGANAKGPKRCMEGPTGSYVVAMAIAELCGGDGSMVDTIDFGALDFRVKRPRPTSRIWDGLRSVHASGTALSSSPMETDRISGEGDWNSHHAQGQGGANETMAPLPSRHPTPPPPPVDPRVPRHLPHEPGGPLWSESDPVWGSRSGDNALQRMIERCGRLKTLGYQNVMGLSREFSKSFLEERFG